MCLGHTRKQPTERETEGGLGSGEERGTRPAEGRSDSEGGGRAPREGRWFGVRRRTAGKRGAGQRARRGMEGVSTEGSGPSPAPPSTGARLLRAATGFSSVLRASRARSDSIVRSTSDVTSPVG